MEIAYKDAQCGPPSPLTCYVSSKRMRWLPFICCLMACILTGCSTPAKSAADLCTTNMMAILSKLDEAEGDGDRFPGSLNVLLDASPSLFVCPASGHRSGRMTNVDDWTDYIYVPNAQDWMRLRLAVLICPPENHHGKYGHVVFGGGMKERLPPDEVRKLIREPWSAPGEKGCTIWDGVGGKIPFETYARTNVTVHIPKPLQALYSR